jgi:hypothetical protein
MLNASARFAGCSSSKSSTTKSRSGSSRARLISPLFLHASAGAIGPRIRKAITGEDLIGFVNNDLFPALKQLASKAGVSSEGKVIGSVFEDAYNYMKSGTLLRQVINKIEEDVDFNSSKDRHLFNDIYEKILADLQSAGNAGEYYTPRAVTQFMVDILNPDWVSLFSIRPAVLAAFSPVQSST